MLHSYIPTGIEEQLKYIKELGFDSIWLSPIYEDGGKDMGNDVKNHNNKVLHVLHVYVGVLSDYV